jgi:hypothetical protein
MNELDSDIRKLSSLIDNKLRAENGCLDELAQLRRLLHLQIATARALGVALPEKRIPNGSFHCRAPLAR